MKAHLNRVELAEALGAIGMVAAPRTPKPILQCVLIDARGDHCLLAATDLELGIRFTVAQVEVEKKGTVVLLADKLGQIVRESMDEVIQMESDDSVCHVRGEGSHYQIFTQDAADFPPVAELEGDGDFELSAGQLRRMTEWTVFSAARENTRYAINGVLWEKRDDELCMVATDGRRLSLSRGKVSSLQGGDMECIVPVKAMTLLQRIVGDTDASVQVKVSGTQLVVRSSRATVSTGLVEGQFPKYRDVIPTDFDRCMRAGTAEFQSAMRRAALLTNEESKGVRLHFDDGTLTLASRAPNQGEATIKMPIEFEGAELEIGFNPHFLIEALKIVKQEKINFELKDANRPGLLRADEGFLYVVMPVNLS